MAAADTSEPAAFWCDSLTLSSKTVIYDRIRTRGHEITPVRRRTSGGSFRRRGSILPFRRRHVQPRGRMVDTAGVLVGAITPPARSTVTANAETWAGVANC